MCNQFFHGDRLSQHLVLGSSWIWWSLSFSLQSLLIRMMRVSLSFGTGVAQYQVREVATSTADLAFATTQIIGCVWSDARPGVRSTEGYITAEKIWKVWLGEVWSLSEAAGWRVAQTCCQCLLLLQCSCGAILAGDNQLAGGKLDSDDCNISDGKDTWHVKLK